MGREAGRLTLSEDDRRVLAVWAADCADRTLALFEAQASGDTRPRDAIDGLRASRVASCASARLALYRLGRTQRLARSAIRPP